MRYFIFFLKIELKKSDLFKKNIKASYLTISLKIGEFGQIEEKIVLKWSKNRLKMTKIGNVTLLWECLL